MNNRKKIIKIHFQKHWRVYTLIIILAMPVIVALVSALYIIGGIGNILNQIEAFRNNLTLQASDFPTLSEIIYYLICTYTLVITGIFSWAILQSSIKSNKLAEELKNKEDNKENESIRESALIVYYDLFLGIKDLNNLYLSRIINKKNPMPRKMFFSNEWIKNVAVLKNNLSSDEINNIYSLYGKFLTIASLLDNVQTLESYLSILDEEVLKLVSEMYSTIFPKAFLKKYEDAPQKLLNRKYYLLLEKLRILTYKKEQYKITKDNKIISTNIYLDSKPIYSGDYEGSNFNGYGNYYLPNGKIKFQGIFKDGYFISGTVREFYSDDTLMYEVVYKDGIKIYGKLFYREDTELFGGKLCYKGKFKDNLIVDGFAERYYSKKFDVLYRGYLLNGKYEGRGVEYYNNYIRAEYDGIWKNGKIQKGEFFGNEEGVKHFKGEFRNSEPFNGIIEYGKSYVKDYINEFKGEIKEGKPYNGKGKVMFLDWREYTYRDIDMLVDEENNEICYDDELDKECEIQYKKESFDEVKSKYFDWEEYIDAEWQNGKFEVKEDDVLNKEIFYKKYSEKKH